MCKHCVRVETCSDVACGLGRRSSCNGKNGGCWTNLKATICTSAPRGLEYAWAKPRSPLHRSSVRNQQVNDGLVTVDGGSIKRLHGRHVPITHATRAQEVNDGNHLSCGHARAGVRVIPTVHMRVKRGFAQPKGCARRRVATSKCPLRHACTRPWVARSGSGNNKV